MRLEQKRFVQNAHEAARLPVESDRMLREILVRSFGEQDADVAGESQGIAYGQFTVSDLAVGDFVRRGQRTTAKTGITRRMVGG